jgi:hypothetical protein
MFGIQIPTVFCCLNNKLAQICCLEVFIICRLVIHNLIFKFQINVLKVSDLVKSLDASHYELVRPEPCPGDLGFVAPGETHYAKEFEHPLDTLDLNANQWSGFKMPSS